MFQDVEEVSSSEPWEVMGHSALAGEQKAEPHEELRSQEHKLATGGVVGREVLSAYGRPVCLAVLLSVGCMNTPLSRCDGPVTPAW